MKGLKLICSFWVAVGFVLFFLDSFPGVSTHVMYSNLPNEASYEVVDVSEEWVREFKSGRYKYAHTVEYSTDGGIKQYTAPLMCKEYPVGFVGTLLYNDSVVVLLEEVTDSTTSTVITLGILENHYADIDILFGGTYSLPRTRNSIGGIMINKTSGRCIAAAEVLLLLLTIVCSDIMNVWIKSGLLLMLSGVGVALCFCLHEPS